MMRTSAGSNGFKQSPTISTLYSDNYVSLLAEVPGTLIRLQRSNIPHPTIEDLERSFGNVAVAIDRLGRAGRVMLIDMREALGRNEPEFDAALRKIRPLVERGLLRIVVLLRSSAGMLQMKRVNEEDGIPRALTMHEHEALEFLRTGHIASRSTSSNRAMTDSRRR